MQRKWFAPRSGGYSGTEDANKVPPPSDKAVRDFMTKDSGKRESFVTGSVRDTRENKGRYDLLSVIGTRRLAQLYERGAAKYGDRNWEKGQPLSRYLDSAIRHTFQLLAGDKEEDHAAAVAWNMFAFMHTEESIRLGKLPKELDDLGWTNDVPN